MAPIRRSREYDDDYSDDFVDELPWDPFLDYVMGDDGKSKKKSGSSGKRQQESSDGDSFLNLLFPTEEGSRSQMGSRSVATKKTSIKKETSSRSGGKSLGSRMGFWRRKKKRQQESTDQSGDMWEMGSISSFEEFFEGESAGTRKQKDQSKRQGQGQSRGIAIFSSGKRTQKSATKEKVSTNPAPVKRSVENSHSLLNELAQTFDPWGSDGYSSSEDSRSEDYTQDEASSYESTEGPSLLTDDDDNSTIASRSEASSLFRDKGKRDTSTVYNEVRLKFRSDKNESSALPPLAEDEEEDEDESRGLPNGFDERRALPDGFDERRELPDDFVERRALSNAFDKRRALSNGIDERRDEAAQYEPEPIAVQEIDDNDRFDIGPDWDVAPIVPAASIADEESLARSETKLKCNDSWLARNERKIVRSDSWSLDRSVPQPRGIASKLVCCGVSNLTEEQWNWSRQNGVAIQELSADELATIFPKLRLVSDKKESQYRSEVIGNSNSFEKNLPANLQWLPSKSLVEDSGPQSLYEYEFERGTHMNVTFAGFGPLPRTLIKVETHKEPPRSYEKGLVSFNKILVQIEASTVSQTDCFIRRGEWWGKRQVSLPNTPGVDIVGKLYRIDKESAQLTGLKTGDRVLSLTKWGGNSRYLSVDPEKLVKVPESVDPAEAACLVETYLTAFQLLHYSQSPGSRYRKKSLKGKIFLILGAITPNMGRAIAQLATFAGTDVIYATSKPKHFQQLKSLGFVPLSQDPVDWWEKLKGRVDLIISLGESVTPLAYKLIKDSGEIVIATNSEVDLAPDVELIRQPSKLICTRSEAQRKSRTHLYDVYAEWDKNLAKCKKDLVHLVKLLEMRAIVPHVLDRIPLGKVARAQEIVESKRLSGFLVCEPWLLTKARAILL